MAIRGELATIWAGECDKCFWIGEVRFRLVDAQKDFGDHMFYDCKRQD